MRKKPIYQTVYKDCEHCGKRYSNHNTERRQAFFAQYFCGIGCKDAFTKKALVAQGAKCE